MTVIGASTVVIVSNFSPFSTPTHLGAANVFSVWPQSRFGLVGLNWASWPVGGIYVIQSSFFKNIFYTFNACSSILLKSKELSIILKNIWAYCVKQSRISLPSSCLRHYRANEHSKHVSTLEVMKIDTSKRRMKFKALFHSEWGHCMPKVTRLKGFSPRCS